MSDKHPPKKKNKLLGLGKAIKRHGSSLISNLGSSAPVRPLEVYENVGAAPIANTNLKTSITIAVIGDEGVGKSSIIERFSQKAFFTGMEPTICPKFIGKNLVFNRGKAMLKVRFKIWDTPGNRTMAPILNSFTQNSQFTVAVYSLISKESFEYARNLITEAEDSRISANGKTFLVGTKSDELGAGKCNFEQEINQFLQENTSIDHFQLSAKVGSGVDEFFNAISIPVVDELEVEASKPTVAPSWVPDESSTRCTTCKSAWTVTNRRHHCRMCGLLFCSGCAYQFIPIPQIGKFTPTRVCTGCFEEITGGK